MLCKECQILLPKSSKPNKSGLCYSCRRVAAKSCNSTATREYQKEYRARHREKRLQEKRDWYLKNKEHKLAKDKENIAKDPEAHRKRQRNARAKQLKNDPQYAMRTTLKTRLNNALKATNNKKFTKSSTDLYGCSLEDLVKYIESQFYNHPETNEEMNWDNHTLKGWHIDHIKPFCSFDLTKEEDIIAVCHYTNLRPLWSDEHKEKTKQDVQQWKNSEQNTKNLKKS